MLKILCTSVGNDGFPSVLSSLRKRANILVVGVDSNQNAAGLRLADVGIVVPPRNEPDRLVIALKQIIDNNKIDVIIPLSTEDQPFFAKYFEYFSPVPVVVSPIEVVNKVNDKHALYLHAQFLGIPIPNFNIIYDPFELEKKLLEYKNKGELCVLKKSHGTGAQGVKIVNPQITYRDKFWQRDNIEITTEEAINWVQSGLLSEPILVSEYLPGEHLSVDSFRSLNGNFHCVVRIETNQLYGTGVSGVIISEPSLSKITQKLAESLGLIFAFNVEYKRDIFGEPKLLEINPRFGASVGHSVAAGLNSPLMAVDEALGKTIHIEEVKVGLEFRRFGAFITW